MRHYETLFIINPEINEEDTDQVVEKFAGILTDRDAVMAKIEKWGRRRLAYTVKKYKKGYYVLFDYGATHDAVAEMERIFKIDESVIRFLTVKKGDFFDPDSVVKPTEMDDSETAETAAQEDGGEEAPQADALTKEAAPAEAPAQQADPKEAPAQEAEEAETQTPSQEA